MAAKLLKDAELIAVSASCLCEFAWVLREIYSLANEAIADAIRALFNASNVAMNRPAVEMGLAILDAGGNFADGVIAYEGYWLEAETFFSFDKRAVKLLQSQGLSAQLLS